jgi:hypothetical protein
MLKAVAAFTAALTLTVAGSAQAPYPALPGLRFAQIVARDKYLGDRWS